MAVFSCTECEGKVSSEAETCPHCGAPVKAMVANIMTKRRAESKKGQGAAAQGGTGFITPARAIIWGPILLLFVWMAAAIVENPGSDVTNSRYGEGDTRGMSQLAPAAPTVARNPVEQQFSALNGSHMKLTRKIKDRLHDPGSYSHDQTTYQVEGGKVYIVTRFRAKNAMGAMVINLVSAHAGVKGDGSDVAILSWD